VSAPGPEKAEALTYTKRPGHLVHPEPIQREVFISAVIERLNVLPFECYEWQMKKNSPKAANLSEPPGKPSGVDFVFRAEESGPKKQVHELDKCNLSREGFKGAQ
jgi:hypothetical protein